MAKSVESYLSPFSLKVTQQLDYLSPRVPGQVEEIYDALSSPCRPRRVCERERYSMRENDRLAASLLFIGEDPKIPTSVLVDVPRDQSILAEVTVHASFMKDGEPKGSYYFYADYDEQGNLMKILAPQDWRRNDGPENRVEIEFAESRMTGYLIIPDYLNQNSMATVGGSFVEPQVSKHIVHQGKHWTFQVHDDHVSILTHRFCSRLPLSIGNVRESLLSVNPKDLNNFSAQSFNISRQEQI